MVHATSVQILSGNIICSNLLQNDSRKPPAPENQVEVQPEGGSPGFVAGDGGGVSGGVGNMGGTGPPAGGGVDSASTRGGFSNESNGVELGGHQSSGVGNGVGPNLQQGSNGSGSGIHESSGNTAGFDFGFDLDANTGGSNLFGLDATPNSGSPSQVCFFLFAKIKNLLHHFP